MALIAESPAFPPWVNLQKPGYTFTVYKFLLPLRTSWGLCPVTREKCQHCLKSGDFMNKGIIRKHEGTIRKHAKVKVTS